MTLLENDNTGPTSWFGNLPVTSRYTYGIAGERFFRAIKDEGKIYGSYCPQCMRTYVPASMFCERCLGKLDEWIDVGTIGEVHTFTMLHKNQDGSRRDLPETIAFISIGDGGIIHRLGQINQDDIEIGMKVEAVFKDKEDREGSILDIVYFKPVID